MTVKPGKLRIGTRGSPLALRQTEIVCAELARTPGFRDRNRDYKDLRRLGPGTGGAPP
ncbi:MAG: hypothetical protein IPJ01_13755 [Micavibrio sp.]|nr:hypothetical protein [Micavibrio sp.]